MFVPDHTREDLEEGADHGGYDGPDGRGVRYLEWTWDPDPADNWALTEYSLILRDADGSVNVVHETHRFGLFARDEWLGLLAEAGFEPTSVPEVASEKRTPREIFIAHRPSS